MPCPPRRHTGFAERAASRATGRATDRLAAAGLAALVVLGAASCATEPAPEQNPEQATKTLTEKMSLDPAASACLRKALDDKPSIATVMNLQQDRLATPKQVEEFLTATRPCFTPDVVANTYVKILPTAVNASAEQARCVHDTVVAFDQDTRDDLVLLAVGATTANLQDLAKAVTKVAQTCNLTQPVGAPEGPGQTVTGGGAAAPTLAPNDGASAPGGR